MLVSGGQHDPEIKPNLRFMFKPKALIKSCIVVETRLRSTKLNPTLDIVSGSKVVELPNYFSSNY